jgi:hypothetical protein
VILLAIVLGLLQSGAPALPFKVGERLEYGAKFGVLNVGSASIAIPSVDTVLGDPAYHFRFTLEGGALFFKINSSLDSWTRTRDFHSVRFRRDSKENSRHYIRAWEIRGDSGYYRQTEPEVQPQAPTPSDPLDDASFLYFVRTTPLEVGKTYEFRRYFRGDRNPITISVLKRETMELPDGSKVPCLVLNPVIGETGLFAKRAEARLWLTDDTRRIPVQIRSRYSFGEITLKLQRIAQTGGN